MHSLRTSPISSFFEMIPDTPNETSASGVYLAAFILGHMNSVFVYARMHLGIPTD